MQNYYKFANDTKDYIPAYAAALAALVLASGSKHVFGEYAGRAIQFITLVLFMILALSFGKHLLTFIMDNLSDIPSDENSNIRPNLTFACLICVFSLLLLLYGAYLLIA